jgi:predicted amidophosphoribosyltransferase
MGVPLLKHEHNRDKLAVFARMKPMTTTGMKFCPGCGRRISSNKKTCAACQSNQPQGSHQTQ